MMLALLIGLATALQIAGGAGNTIHAGLCPRHRKEFRLDAEPITEWWIRITVNGEPAGWLLVTDAVVKLVDRLG